MIWNHYSIRDDDPQRAGNLRWSSLHRFAIGPATAQADGEGTKICEGVLAAAHREAERLNDVSAPLSPVARSRVEALLGVISYCYAKGCFDSAEIEERLWEDEAFLATFGQEVPRARSIRAFRRRHRENILAIIEQSLSDYGSAGSGAPPAIAVAPDAAWTSAHHRAEQLLDMANIMDQLASD